MSIVAPALLGRAFMGPGHEHPPMSVSGLCEICERGEVDHACDRCGALVCDDHYDTTLGLCVECAAEVDPEGKHRGLDPNRTDETDTYQF